jgi:hypothetical protein
VAQQAWQRDENQAWRHDAPTIRPDADIPTPGPPAGAVRLTSRGAVLLMAAAFILGLLADALFGWAVLAGVAFVLGSAAAARYTKAADLLKVAVTPPLVFFCVLLCAKAMSATGNVAVSVIGGSALTLASIAPWLFAGTAVNLIIGYARGLPRCVGDLRRSLSPPATAARDAGRPTTHV